MDQHDDTNADAPAVVSIRAAGPDDADELLRVHRSAILELTQHAYTPAEIRSWAARLEAGGYIRAMEQRGERFHVALGAGGGVVGFYGRVDAEVMALYVDPAWARRGVGTALLAHAERAIAADGHAKVKIGAALSGRDFYLARGYGVDARVDWETRGGLVLEACDVSKVLDLKSR